MQDFHREHCADKLRGSECTKQQFHEAQCIREMSRSACTMEEHNIQRQKGGRDGLHSEFGKHSMIRSHLWSQSRSQSQN